MLPRTTLGEMLQAYRGIVAADSQLVEKGVGAVLDGLLSVTFLISMSQKMPASTLVIVAVALVMTFLAMIIGRIQAGVLRNQVDAQAKQHGYLTELLAGCRMVKATGAENRCIHRWIRLFRKERLLELRKDRIGLWSEVGFGTFQHALTVTMLI